MTDTNSRDLLDQAKKNQDPVVKALLKKVEETSEAYLKLYYESRKKTITIAKMKMKLEKLESILREAGPTLAYQ